MTLERRERRPLWPNLHTYEPPVRMVPAPKLERPKPGEAPPLDLVCPSERGAFER